MIRRPHTVPCDRGLTWIRDVDVAVDAVPDDDPDPDPAARWPADAPRPGRCGAVAPDVV